MLELNRRLGINLGHTELEYCYTLCNVGRDSYKVYLRAIDKSREIEKCLPSSGKGVDDVRLWVTKPWQLGNIPKNERPLGWCLKRPRDVG